MPEIYILGIIEFVIGIVFGYFLKKRKDPTKVGVLKITTGEDGKFTFLFDITDTKPEYILKSKSISFDVRVTESQKKQGIL